MLWRWGRVECSRWGVRSVETGREIRIQKRSLLLISASSLFTLLERRDCRLLLIEVLIDFQNFFESFGFKFLK